MRKCHNRPRLLIGLALLLGLILTACGERQPAAGEATNSIQLVAQDIRFQPEALTIQAKQKVRLTFTNRDNERHTVEIEGVESIGLGVLPNSEATFEFTMERPGVYTIFCGVADHRQRGMVAQLTVQP